MPLTQVEPQTLAQMPFKVLDETLRQLRSTRNDIIRYGVWNTRNLTDDEFNHADDRKLLGYFGRICWRRGSSPKAGAST